MTRPDPVLELRRAFGEEPEPVREPNLAAGVAVLFGLVLLVVLQALGIS